MDITNALKVVQAKGQEQYFIQSCSRVCNFELVQ